MTANGLIVKKSALDFNETYTKLKNTIDANPNLSILLELDHSKNAASVGLELNPTRIILFGNPKLGTLLMQNKQTVNIDLPQKISVYQDASNEVAIAYNDPLYLKERHGLDGNLEVLDKISTALDKITTMAIAK